MGDNPYAGRVFVIPLAWIEAEQTTQSRCQVRQETIDNYAELLREGVKLPPITTFFDGASYWIGDGWHRFLAACQTDPGGHIEVTIETGGQREALKHSLNSNHDHGLPRTRDDKRRAVILCLYDPEWSSWTDKRISIECGVSRSLVRTVRHEEFPPEITDAAALDASSLDNELDDAFVAFTEEQDAALVSRHREPASPSSRPDAAGEAAGIAAEAATAAVEEAVRAELQTDSPPPETIEQIRAPYLAIVQALRAVSRSIKIQGQTARGAHLAVAQPRLHQILKDVAVSVKSNSPAAWCPKCKGAGCMDCFRTGVVTVYVLQSQQRS